MLVSKSLFVDYADMPQLAWWKQNELDTYKRIMGMDEDKERKIEELGQRTEDVVDEYFTKVEGLVAFDAFEAAGDIDALRYDFELASALDGEYAQLLEENLTQTIRAMSDQVELIVQPGFMIDDLYVRGDYLKLNENGNYDLIEVKSTSAIRKTKTHEGVKNKNAGNLEDRYLQDISFQKYVINRVLRSEKLADLENYYYAYMNGEYVKNGPVDISDLLIFDQVDSEQERVLKGKKANKTITIADPLLSETYIESRIESLREELGGSKADLDLQYPFNGTKYTEYTGKERKFGTIFSPGLNAKKTVKELYAKGKINLDDLDEEELDAFNTPKGEVGSARKFVDRYLEAKTHGDLIDRAKIALELGDMRYPICFYDYETCSVPVPFIDGTVPHQQVVVQYSLHKVYEDGQIRHYGGILKEIGEKQIEFVELEGNPNKVDHESEKLISGSYEDLLEAFADDIGEDADKSFIVWNKSFENTRNSEIAHLAPEYAELFENITKNTYDLMDIFQKGYYYSLDFEGSSSIKSILPALVPDMSYDGMKVADGQEAMQVINAIINTDVYSEEEKDAHIRNLLLYCGQDSLAMYKIYQEVLKRIEE